MDQNQDQQFNILPEMVPNPPIVPEPKTHGKLVFIAVIIAVVAVAGILFWKFVPNEHNTPDTKMKAVYDAYFVAIANDNYEAWTKTLDPSAEQRREAFNFIAQSAKEGGMLVKNQNAQFVKTIDVSQRYNIPGLVAYLTSFENNTEDPLVGIGGEKKGPFTTRVNAFFMTQMGGEWKIKAFSVFNHRGSDFEAELERFMERVFF